MGLSDWMVADDYWNIQTEMEGTETRLLFNHKSRIVFFLEILNGLLLLLTRLGVAA